MKFAKEILPLIIIREVITILVKLKKTIIGTEIKKPITLLFIAIPAEEKIAADNRQNSNIPEHIKLIIIGSFRLGTRIIDIFAMLSKEK